jgi:hypothetical protein
LVIIKKLIAKVAHQTICVGQLASVASMWLNVKWKMKIWLLYVPQWRDVLFDLVKIHTVWTHV